MFPTLRVLASAVLQVATRPGWAFLGNMLAVILNLPLLGLLSVIAGLTSLSILPLGVTLLLGVLPNPAFVGLQTAARGAVEMESVSLKEQWQEVKALAGPTSRAWLVGCAVSAVVFVNLTFYSGIGRLSGLHVLAGPLTVLWGCVLIVWLAIHLYVFPLLLRQEGVRVRDAYRNAAVIALSRPIYTLFLAAVWLGWLLVTATTGPAYLFGLAVAAAVQQNALARVLPSFERPASSAG